MANTVNESAIKKLKVLFTVVDRNKGEFYMDVISQFEMNCQMQLQGLGMRYNPYLWLVLHCKPTNNTRHHLSLLPSSRHR